MILRAPRRPLPVDPRLSLLGWLLPIVAPLLMGSPSCALNLKPSHRKRRSPKNPPPARLHPEWEASTADSLAVMLAEWTSEAPLMIQVIRALVWMIVPALCLSGLITFSRLLLCLMIRTISWWILAMAGAPSSKMPIHRSVVSHPVLYSQAQTVIRHTLANSRSVRPAHSKSKLPPTSKLGGQSLFV